ncbi:MAG: carboxypeptidase-like regulatory domain-containing protein [Bacteroidales bacterium]|nr:carboxypeptidase-like regulatory domain-containing protein [Bacteroidales bacterium]
MKEKDKHIKTDSPDFLRYLKGTMSDQERNAFERELQKDPFAEEAAEGLSQISPEEVSADLADLGKRLKKRISRKQRFIYYRIAASVAVLMVITSVFIIIERSRPGTEISEISMNQVTFDIPESKSLREPPIVTRESDYKELPARDKNESVPAKQKGEITPVETADAGEKVLAAAEKSEALIQADIKAAATVTSERRAAAPAPAALREKSNAMTVRGKILSSEDNMPLPGANVVVKGTTKGAVTDTEGRFSITLPDEAESTLIANFIGMETKEFRVRGDSDLVVRLDPSVMALSEVVVVGYGIARSEDDEQTGYTPPVPVTGKRSFDRYIGENMKKPGTLTPGQKAIVVVNFIVRRNGIVDSIKVIRSPGFDFSDEAIRLIKEGPSWNPAENNGITVDDEVRIRIVFK